MKEKDKRIIEILKKDSRVPVIAISKKTGIPDTTIHFRLKKIQECVDRFTLCMDHEKMGYTLYMLEVEPERYALDFITEKNVESVINNLKKIEGVLFVAQSNGSMVAFCRSKERPNIEIPGASVRRILPIKRRWGNFAEY
ncbi:MAG: winged helix-turn-helix transcriptional regulator [Theionarchaea archaeon]|nr:winged helix-turn-helix transcriptional regulator [Theionarchaea archaeon]MBU7037184.1 winged helix-turn-helix transcriptional regulator [Theionarchaea archaeon]